MKKYMITILSLLLVFTFFGPANAFLDVIDNTDNSVDNSTNANANVDDVSATINTNSINRRGFAIPGGLILPGFPTNVDTNGGTGAQYIATRTQLQFKNVWTLTELDDGNQKWCGNKASVNMYVGKTTRPSSVTLDYIRQMKKDDQVVEVLPIDTNLFEYRFLGYVFVRATSQNIMAPENTIDAARKMSKYGANFAIVLNDGVEKTMVASSFGIALGYSHMIMSTDEGHGGAGTAGIGYSTGKSGMKGFPFVQFACFQRTAKVEKTSMNTTVNTPDAPVVKTLVTPAPKAPATTNKSNIRGYNPDLKL